jgi:Fic family protein
LFAIGTALVAAALSYWDMQAATVLAILALVILALIEFAKRGSRSLREATETRSEQKAENKETIMNLFNGRREITNDDVEFLLRVSDSTATNYLQELEDEGRIEQLGTTGRHVRYRRKGE